MSGRVDRLLVGASAANPAATMTRCACCDAYMQYVASDAPGVRTFKGWCPECVKFVAKSKECEEAMRVLQDRLLSNGEWVQRARENRFNADWDEALKDNRSNPYVYGGRRWYPND